VSGELTDEQIVERIRVMVEAELQRRGLPGRPRIDGRFLVVGKGASAVRADLGGTIQQWDSLPEDLLERRVQQMAQLLSEGAQRAPVASRRPPPQRAQGSGALAAVRRAVAPLLIVALMVCALGVAYRYLSPSKQSPLVALDHLLSLPTVGSASASAAAPSNDASNIEHERAVIASAACAKSRTRVARGGSVGPADVEGWQVELVLLRRGAAVDLSQSVALTSFVRRDAGSKTAKLSWAKARSLLAQERFDAQIDVRAMPALGTKNLSGVSLMFSGPYVVPYFTEDQRSDYFLLADALADALGATDGGLFAHCADSESHHVGSWFLGATPGATVGSLIFFMEGYSDQPVLKAEVLGSGPVPERRGHAFDAIDRAAGSLSRSSVATLVGGELGMISGRPNHPARLTFPFRDGNRASRAGLEVARSLGLASSR
jgi:hypothetical protein